MSAVTKVSQITVSDVGNFLRLPTGYATGETDLLTGILTSAKSYCEHYTGKTLEQLDEYPDVVVAVLVLCQDMYDNRSLYVNDDTEPNKVVTTILGLHEVNLL